MQEGATQRLKQKKKVAINVMASFLQQAVAMICGLITPRLMLRAFGSAYNGVISSATQLMSVISILTLGIAGAVRAELYPALAYNDHKKMSEIMKAANDHMHKVGFAVLAYAAVLMLVFPYISHSDIPHAQSALIIGIIAIDTFCLYYFGSNNYQLLIADQKVYLKSFLASGVMILNTIMIALVIHMGGNIFEVKAASALVYMITPVATAIFVKHHYRLDKHCIPPEDTLKKRKDAAAHSLANIIHDNTDTIVLTAFLDIKYVSVYTIYYAIVGKIKTIISESSAGIEAAFGEMWAKQEMDSLRKTFHIYEYVMCLFVIIVFSCVAVLLVPFIELYTDKVTDINYSRTDFALLITAAEAVFCIRQPYRMLVHATGFYKETKKAAIIEAGINLISSILFVYFFGLNGVIIGTLLANAYRTLSYSVFVSKNVLMQSMRPVLARWLWTGTTMLLTVIVSECTLSFIKYGGWGGWMIKGFAAFFISVVIAVMMSVFFFRTEFTEMSHLLIKKIHSIIRN